MNNYTFNDFINECLHTEMFHSDIPIMQRTPDVAEQEDDYELTDGTPLIYDTIQKRAFVFDEDKYEYYESRYVMLGAVMRYTKRQITVLSPYFIKVCFNPKKMKKTSDFVTKLERSVKSITKDVVKRLGKDVTIEMLHKDDVCLINNALPEIAEALNSLSTYILFQYNINKILIQESSILADGSILLNSFGPAFLASQDHDYTAELAAQCEYKQLSTEEFFNAQTGIVDSEPDTDSEQPEETDASADEKDPQKHNNIIYSFAQFKKEFSKADWFECYIPIVFKIDTTE